MSLLAAYFLLKILSKVSQYGIEFVGRPKYHEVAAPLRVCGKVCRLHLRVLLPLVLLWPSRNFANGHLLKTSHLGQTWAASSQKLEVSRVMEVLS